MLYYVGMDPKTSRWAKLTLGGALVYIFSPPGILLDFLPPLGEELDFAALVLAGGVFLLSIRKHHLDHAWEKTRWLFEGGREPPPPRPPEPPILEIEKPKPTQNQEKNFRQN
ncbi:MAG: YkvA family protein [Opitutales bacterium]